MAKTHLLESNLDPLTCELSSSNFAIFCSMKSYFSRFSKIAIRACRKGVRLSADRFHMLLASTGLPQSAQSAYDLYFTKSGTSDYVIHHGLQITDAFTVCYRMRTAEKAVYDATVVSYSANQVHNEILIKDADSLELWINDELL